MEREMGMGNEMARGRRLMCNEMSVPLCVAIPPFQSNPNLASLSLSTSTLLSVVQPQTPPLFSRLAQTSFIPSPFLPTISSRFSTAICLCHGPRTPYTTPASPASGTGPSKDARRSSIQIFTKEIQHCPTSNASFPGPLSRPPT
jgi:hypothetical protein